MNYYSRTGFNWGRVLTPFLGIVLVVATFLYFEHKQAARAKLAQTEDAPAAMAVLEDMERSINKEIISHYEKIDSLIYVRDSVISEHSAKTVTELQRAIDSVFNHARFPDLSDPNRGR